MWKSLTAVLLCTLFAIPAFGQTTMQHIGLPAPTAAGGVFLNVVHEAGAAEVALTSAGTYYVLDTSINTTEAKDVTNQFTVSASQDEVCYTGSENIEVLLEAHFSFSATTLAVSPSVYTFSFAQNSTGAIVDGDEAAFGLGLSRVVSAAGSVMGSITGGTTLTSASNCISLMGSSDGANDGVTMLGFSLTITEPGTGGSGDSAVAGANGYIQYNNAGNHGGTANATLDASGNATFATVTTADVSGSNAVVLFDNDVAGYTDTLTALSNDIAIYADSTTEADVLFYEDDAGTSRQIVNFESDGDLGTTKSGQSEADGTSDNWSIEVDGDFFMGQSHRMFDLDGATWYSVSREFVSADNAGGEYTREVRILDAGLALDKRIVTTNLTPTRFAEGDGGETSRGIALHKTSSTSFYTQIVPGAISADTLITLPIMSGEARAITNNVADATATTTLITEVYGHFHVATGTGMVYTLPEALDLMDVCFFNQVAQALSITPVAGAIYLTGANSGAGKMTDGEKLVAPGTVGDSVCLRGDDSGDWFIYSMVNTWTEETP